MYKKLYKSNRFRRVQRVKSDARHHWMVYDKFYGWLTNLTHKKPKNSENLRIHFKGRVGVRTPYIGIDIDRNWKGKRFVVEKFRKSPRFLRRLGWRKDFYLY